MHAGCFVGAFIKPKDTLIEQLLGMNNFAEVFWMKLNHYIGYVNKNEYKWEVRIAGISNNTL